MICAGMMSTAERGQLTIRLRTPVEWHLRSRAISSQHMSHMVSYVSDRNRRDLRAESASNSASSWFTGLSPKWILPSASDCVKQWAQCRADHSRRVGIAACIPGISQSYEPIHGREESKRKRKDV